MVTWWPSRNIPPRSSKTLETGCHGITRPASPLTIPDEPAPPNILNQRLPWRRNRKAGDRLPPPSKYFPLRMLIARTQPLAETLNFHGSSRSFLPLWSAKEKRSCVIPYSIKPHNCLFFCVIIEFHSTHLNVCSRCIGESNCFHSSLYFVF